MHPSRRSNDERTRERADRERTDRERGSASLEFITLSVLLLVPLVYLVLALAAVQAGAFAAEGAARYGARVAVLARHDGSAPAAAAAAERAVGLAFDDFGLTGATARTTVSCHPAGRCTDAGARVRVEVTASVPLPFVPDVFGLTVGAVGVEGVATQTVSKYAAVTR